MLQFLDISSWSWQALVLVKIVAGSLLVPYAGRLVGDAPALERTRRILIQYCWAVSFALVAVYLFRYRLTFSSMTWGMVLVGVLQPFGGFFYLRALAWSASRVPIFFSLTTVIPLVLSAVLLGEWRALVVNPMLLVGALLAIVGILLHYRHDAKLKREKDGAEVPLAFYGYSAIFVLIFGLGMFGWNYWAKGGAQAAEVIVAWYGGALAGACVLLVALTSFGTSGGAVKPISSAKLHTLIALMGLGIVLNLIFGFLPLQKVEQVVVLPIYALGDIVGPILIGMIIFHEWKKIQGLGWLYLTMGHLGGVVIAFSR